MADSHRLEKKLRYAVMMQKGSLKCIGRSPSWIFEIKLFTCI